jgi:serine/threonine protein kinase
VLGASLGNYRVVEQLGEGGMGVVYIGRHETLSRRVVVKVLRPEMSRHADMVQRFFNEAQAATAIHNPGIAQVFDYGMAPNGSAFIVMELLQGETLTARLRQRQLDIVECCRIGRQIANVLQAAHAAGITHRDLKPDNLFLVPDPEVAGGERVKVLDFGIAKLASELHAAGVKTRTDVVMGTPSYMSPEQCRSAVTAEPRSDIYSLGCLLFEMVCGRPPFVGGGLGDIIGAHLHTPPPDPRTLAPGVPPALAELILHLLAKRPEARPQTMAAVSQRLDEILHALGESSPRAPTPLPVFDPTLQDSAPPFSPDLAPAHTLPPDETQPSGETLPLDATLPPGEVSLSERPTTPVPIAPQTPSPAHAPTPVPKPSALSPHERPIALVPVRPARPLSAHPKVPSRGPQAAPRSDTAEKTSILPRSHSRPRPLVLGGVAILTGIATVIVSALATKESASPKQPSTSDEVMVTSRHEDAATGVDTAAVADNTATADAATAQVLAQPPTAIVVDAADKTAPAINADDLDTECRTYQAAQKWNELEQCADKLQPLDPKRAAELKTVAVEEAKAAPRIAAVEAALRDKNLKQAKAALDQVWTRSVDYPNIKSKYDLAEGQAIAELAAELEHVKSSDCAAYNARLAKERPLKPTRVITEAARRVPCASQLCIGDAYAEKGQEQYAAGQLPRALASYEAAYACRAAPQWAEKALIISCNLTNLVKAKLYWRRLPLTMKARALSICERNGITETKLNAP